MRSPADAALVAADPAVPGFGVLLDDAALAGWLRRHGVPISGVRRRYLRYKPGTSCVLEAELTTASGRAGCFVTAYDEHGADKLGKTVVKAPDRSLLAVDPEGLLLAATPAADRDLPALAVLADAACRRRLLRRLLPGRAGVGNGGVSALHHKPQRRWVGLLRPDEGPPVVLRAYRPGAAARAVGVAHQLAAGPPRTPAVLGADLELGITALQYLPGQVLDESLAAGRASGAELAAAGAALATLHARDLPGLPPRTAQDEVEAVHLAAAQLAVLLPDLADRATGLAEQLAAGLLALTVEPVPLHGDFSTDQVVVGADGTLALIDLDSGALGDPAVDLGCAAGGLAGAAVQSGSVLHPGGLRALYAGYAGVRPLPDPERLGLHTAAQLLRRSVEPFRRCAPGWPGMAGQLLAQAEAAVARAGAAA